MTALLTLERTRPREVFTASDRRPAAVESQIGLRPGERMRVSDLFEALMLESANDAAETLAEGIAGTRDRFVAEMNERAKQLGLDDTSYANPIGLDDPLNYSTARDLAALTYDLMQLPRFARVVDMPSAQLESGVRPRMVENRNLLIPAYPFVNGVKTGHTSQAGYVLVGSARGRTGGRVISVVMGEPSEAGRDVDTLKLLRWGLGRFHRVRVLDPHRPLARADIEYRDEQVALVPQRGAVVTLRDGQHVRRAVRAPDEVSGPLAARERVGAVTVFVDGERVRRVALVTAVERPQSGDAEGARLGVGRPLDRVGSPRNPDRSRPSHPPPSSSVQTGQEMIITVTLNAAIDKTLAVPNFRLGRRHRAVEQTAMAGGKGVNVARALRALGQPVIATGIAGGPTGTRIVEHLTDEGILNDFVRIREESRTSTAVVDPTSGDQTEINEHGPHVSDGRARPVRRQAALPRQGRGRLRVRRQPAARSGRGVVRAADRGDAPAGRDHRARLRGRAAAGGDAQGAGRRVRRTSSRPRGWWGASSPTRTTAGAAWRRWSRRARARGS